MKNQVYRVIAIFGIFIGLAVTGVQGQTPSRVEVNIPFEFSAGTTTFTPGMYRIKRMAGSLLTLTNSDGKSVILDAPVMAGSGDERAGERIVFNKYGDQYLLSEIWLSVDSGRRVTTERKAEKSERVEISLRRK